MSVQSAQSFIERMQRDERFAQDVAEENKKNGTLRGSKVILEAGFSFTRDEMNQAISKIEAAKAADGELSNADLEAVAGGATSTIYGSFSSLGLIGSTGSLSYSKYSSLFDAGAGFGGACGISTAGGCSGVA